MHVVLNVRPATSTGELIRPAPELYCGARKSSAVFFGYAGNPQAVSQDMIHQLDIAWIVIQSLNDYRHTVLDLAQESQAVTSDLVLQLTINNSIFFIQRISRILSQF
jgi:hypothetical protein